MTVYSFQIRIIRKLIIALYNGQLAVVEELWERRLTNSILFYEKTKAHKMGQRVDVDNIVH